MVVNINEELETKITSGLRTIYTVEDRYYNLKQIERSIIRDVFGKEECFSIFIRVMRLEYHKRKL